MVTLYAYRILSGFPPSGTYFSVLIGVLECLNQTQSFVNRSAHRQVIHGNLSQNAAIIDDEQSSGTDKCL